MAQPAGVAAVASPTTAASPVMPAPAPVVAPAVAATTGALIPAPSAAGAVVPAAGATQAAVGTTPAAGANGTAATGAAGGVVDPMNSPYGSGMYGGGMYGSGMYGGYGMDPYMGGMGMMGMGGMGMMGMGGMGMMGMGMYGMTPEAQRSQMMMFMISRMVELWGMFSNVVQMTFGSVIQFAGNYVGINQRLGQIEEEGMTQEERYARAMLESRQAMLEIPESERNLSRQPKERALHRPKKSQKPSFVRTLIMSLLRHVVLITIAYFATKRIMLWYTNRQKAKALAEAAQAMAESTL